MQFSLNAEFVESEQINPFVTRFKAYIAKPQIANGFNFSYDVLNSDEVKTTVQKSPVVAGFVDNDDGSKLGGHAGDLVKSSIGYQRTPKTQAIGFVENTEPWWENHNGAQWLTCYTDIWTTYFSGLDNLSNRNIAQSLELEMNVDGNKNVTACVVKALCMLENVKPAFSGSTFQVTNFSDYENQVEKLKKEFSLYESIDFSIPNNVKDFVSKSIKSNIANMTSICKMNMDYLIENSCISIDKLSDINKYFSSMHNRKTFSLEKENVITLWCTDLINKINKEGVEEKMSVKDKLGKGKEITIDNSKDSAVMSGSWNGQDASFLNDLLESPNHEALVKEGYLIISGDTSGDLSVNDVKYPHHEIKGEKLVVSAPGIQAAFQRARQQNVATGDVLAHIKKHYKELGLSMENFSTFGLNEEEATFMLNDDSMKGGEKAVKMSKNEISEKLSKACESQKITKDDKEFAKYSFLDCDDSEPDGFLYVIDNDPDDDDNDCLNLYAVPYVIADDEDGDVTPDFTKASPAKITLSAKNEDGEEDKVKTALSEKISQAMSAVGQSFAKIQELEASLKEANDSLASEKAQNAKFSEIIKEQTEKEKMSKVENLLKGKEFALFSEDTRNGLLEKAKEKTFEDFSVFAYAELGKYVKDNFSIDPATKKFSFMDVQHAKPKEDNENKDDVYANIRDKFKK